MLALSRRTNEQIIISIPGPIGDVVIAVELLKAGPGNRARIGVHAPGIATVHRKEVWDRIEADRIAATAANERANRPATFDIAEPEQHPPAGALTAGSPTAADQPAGEYERLRVRGEVSGVEVDPT